MPGMYQCAVCRRDRIACCPLWFGIGAQQSLLSQRCRCAVRHEAKAKKGDRISHQLAVASAAQSKGLQTRDCRTPPGGVHTVGGLRSPSFKSTRTMPGSTKLHQDSSFPSEKDLLVKRFMVLKQACSPEYQKAQCAFKDSMIH